MFEHTHDNSKMHDIFEHESSDMYEKVVNCSYAGVDLERLRVWLWGLVSSGGECSFLVGPCNMRGPYRDFTSTKLAETLV